MDDIKQQLLHALVSKRPHTMRIHKGTASDDDVQGVIKTLDDLFRKCGRTLRIDVRDEWPNQN